ncbi:hypothetical protein [Chitinimonas naiadis]
MQLRTLAVLSALAACSLSSAAAKPPAKPLAVVEAYMAAWSSNAGKANVADADVVAAANQAASYFDYEVEYLDSTVGTPQYGAMVARDNVVKAFLASFPNARWEMTGPAKIKGDTVEYDWKFSGNATGPYIMDATCKGSGEAIAFTGHTKIRVKQGRIKYQNDNYSADDFARQVAPSDAACKIQKAAEAKAAEAAAKPAQ